MVSPVDAAAPTASIDTATANKTPMANDCNCMSQNLAYGAIAVFGLAALIGLILIAMLIRKKKEDDQRAGRNV